MKINVFLTVPDGDTCEDCNYGFREHSTGTYRCRLFEYCDLKKKITHDGRWSELLKCDECLKSEVMVCGEDVRCFQDVITDIIRRKREESNK
jgi:hypothetical protein